MVAVTNSKGTLKQRMDELEARYKADNDALKVRVQNHEERVKRDEEDIYKKRKEVSRLAEDLEKKEKLVDSASQDAEVGKAIRVLAKLWFETGMEAAYGKRGGRYW